MLNTFLANLKFAIVNRTPMIVGGGEFSWQECLEIYNTIKELQSK